ncbi:MAG: epoxyqueuosine reductase [Methanomicrobiales archaeon]|nr:epoxyqueuosine reductase [Methanomicrobiales archaeon]
MPEQSCPAVDRDAIARFFSGRKIDAYGIAEVSRIHAPAGRHPRDLLAGCRTIIIIGTLMPDRIFTDAGRTEATREIKETLESAAADCTGWLVHAGAGAVPIMPSLPMKIEDGKLRGLLSLKHCAADAGFGTLGDNTLLVHPVFGNRLALAAVLTNLALDPTPLAATLPACTHCNRCVKACPEGAIQGGTVDITKCRNMTDYIPGPLRGVSWKLMRGKMSGRILTSLLNAAGPYLAIESGCTACMIACPYFQIEKR